MVALFPLAELKLATKQHSLILFELEKVDDIIHFFLCIYYPLSTKYVYFRSYYRQLLS